MNLIRYYKTQKRLSESNDELSLTIDWLRFPCAFAVVFIHCFGPVELNLSDIHSNPLSIQSIYNYLRIFFSNILPVFAVPIFFMLSGFLFFYKLEKFDMRVYVEKLKSRFRTLLMPYLIWIIIYVFFLVMLQYVKDCVTGDVSISDLKNLFVNFLHENGGLKVFWNSSSWGYNNKNIFGIVTPHSGPILVPLWYMRDLMILVLFTPIIYNLINRYKVGVIVLLSVCYILNFWFNVPGFSITGFFWFTLGAFFSIRK